MLRNNIILTVFLYLCVTVPLLAANTLIGRYTILDTTITNADTIMEVKEVTGLTETITLWIHNINISADSLKGYVYIGDYPDSLMVLVDSFMNTNHKFLDLTQYTAPYMILKFIVLDSSATLHPKIVVTYPYTTY